MRVRLMLRALGVALAMGFVAASADAAGLFGPTDIDVTTSRAAKEPLEALVKDVEHQHPAAMFILAKRLFDAGRRDEAVFWFYEGQLRWRALIQYTDPSGQPIYNGEQDHFDVLFSDVGPAINAYANGDIPALAKTIDSVLDWDARHADDFTPAGKAKDDTRAGLAGFKADMLAHKDEIATQRAATAGAANASPDDPYSGEGGAPMGTPAAMLTDYDGHAFASFQAGKTTKSEVIAALGKPEWWSTDKDGSTTIGYSYRKATPGLAMMGLVQRVMVSLTFDAKRVLTAVDLPKEGP